MKAWNEIQGDFEQDKRELKVGEYSINAAGGVGRISCYRPGITLIDFYRTSTVLVKDCGNHGEAVGRVATDKGGATPPPAATP